RPGELPLADAHADRGRALLALAGERDDPLQVRGLRLDAVRSSAPAGVGRSHRPQPRVRPAGHARSLPTAARAPADRPPVRTGRERACDSGLRGDRDAANDLVPVADLLTA